MIAEKTGKKTTLQKGDFGVYRKQDKTVAFSRGRNSMPSEKLLFRSSDDKVFLVLHTDLEILCFFDVISNAAGLDLAIVKNDADCLLVEFV